MSAQSFDLLEDGCHLFQPATTHLNIFLPPNIQTLPTGTAVAWKQWSAAIPVQSQALPACSAPKEIHGNVRQSGSDFFKWEFCRTLWALTAIMLRSANTRHQLPAQPFYRTSLLSKKNQLWSCSGWRKAWQQLRATSLSFFSQHFSTCTWVPKSFAFYYHNPLKFPEWFNLFMQRNT